MSNCAQVQLLGSLLGAPIAGWLFDVHQWYLHASGAFYGVLCKLLLIRTVSLLALIGDKQLKNKTCLSILVASSNTPWDHPLHPLPSISQRLYGAMTQLKVVTDTNVWSFLSFFIYAPNFRPASLTSRQHLRPVNHQVFQNGAKNPYLRRVLHPRLPRGCWVQNTPRIQNTQC